MNIKEFNKVVEEMQELINNTLTSKADEYARGGDRLSNFKTAAAYLNCTPEKALWGFVTKHLVAIKDFIDDLERGHVMSREQWVEKIGDVVCYAVLLMGLVDERLQERTLEFRGGGVGGGGGLDKSEG